ncbi:hypothetical protein SCP_1702910 [Sparassis crispa]|uniref:Ribonuclease H1 N-terminal domain-containing protein n=1 Tax=Sparassis crispa TaxID=139825 RepID=A0A401H694_9APHY|nr:hypothetical protein SCP_1702910 [Sparassis crispa]GBE89965.1 hypothetical protein SCP_1702910 [Sparassis crispa]
MFVPPQSSPEIPGCSLAFGDAYDWTSIRVALEATLAWVIAYESGNFCQCRQPRRGKGELVTELMMAPGNSRVNESVDDDGEFDVVDSEDEGVDVVTAAPAVFTLPTVTAAPTVVPPPTVTAPPAVIPPSTVATPATAAPLNAVMAAGPAAVVPTVVPPAGPAALAVVAPAIAPLAGPAGPAVAIPAGLGGPAVPGGGVGVVPIVAAVIGAGDFEIPPGFAAAPGIELPQPAHPNDTGPFYCITRGRIVGVYTDWSLVAAYVHGISGAFCKRHGSYAAAINAFNAVLAQNTVQVL